jgi:hypothetical protein
MAVYLLVPSKRPFDKTTYLAEGVFSRLGHNGRYENFLIGYEKVKE